MKKHTKSYLVILILLIIFCIVGCSQSNATKKVDCKILFRGFTTLNEHQQFPCFEDCIIFTSEQDWIDFCSKYFDSFPSVVTEINDRAIDFNNENLVFIGSLGPRHSYDLYSYHNFKYLSKEDNKFTIVYDSNKEIGDKIYVLNNEASENSLTKHASVLLLSIKTEDVPDNIENIYKK